MAVPRGRAVAGLRDCTHQFKAGAETFEAWSRFPDDLRATLRDNAPTMRAGIRSSRVQRPFLRDTAAFSRSLRRATQVTPGFRRSRAR